MTLVPSDENKATRKKYEELWDKIRELIKSITYNPDNYDKKYMEIKFNQDGDLPLN